MLWIFLWSSQSNECCFCIMCFDLCFVMCLYFLVLSLSLCVHGLHYSRLVSICIPCCFCVSFWSLANPCVCGSSKSCHCWLPLCASKPCLIFVLLLFLFLSNLIMSAWLITVDVQIVFTLIAVILIKSLANGVSIATCTKNKLPHHWTPCSSSVAPTGHNARCTLTCIWSWCTRINGHVQEWCSLTSVKINHS